jgi:cell division protein FtsB
MNCPICDYKGIEKNAKKCPSCHADLSAYHALDSLEASFNRQKRKTQLFILLFVMALIASIAIFIVLCLLGPDENKQEIVADQPELQALKTEHEQLAADYSKLQEEKESLAKELQLAKQTQFITHTIQKGEYLIGIAEKYWGEGSFYLKLAADNCIEDPDMIFAGDELIILK